MLWAKRRGRKTGRCKSDSLRMSWHGPEATLVPPSNVFQWRGGAGAETSWLNGANWEQGKPPYPVQGVVFGQAPKGETDIRHSPIG